MDYDVASNWGNWVAAAGLTGGRINKFNITKQSRDYDPEGEYIRLWCPELAKVPSRRIHEPWLMSKEEQELYQCRIGEDYPMAIPSSSFAGRGSQPSPAGGKTSNSNFPSRFGNRSSRGGSTEKSSGRRKNAGNTRKDFRARSAFDLFG